MKKVFISKTGEIRAYNGKGWISDDFMNWCPDGNLSDSKLFHRKFSGWQSLLWRMCNRICVFMSHLRDFISRI